MAKPALAIKGRVSSAARASLALPHRLGLRVNERGLVAVAPGLGPHPAHEMDEMRWLRTENCGLSSLEAGYRVILKIQSSPKDLVPGSPLP